MRRSAVAVVPCRAASVLSVALAHRHEVVRNQATATAVL
jgi:hypothetical protein